MATKSEEAYKKILKLLLRHHFCGQDNRFSVRELSRTLNMSVVPISEAIRRLQQLGLIICQPRKKIRVKILSSKEQLDVMVVREGLECQAVNLVARFADPETLEKLKAKAEKIDEAIIGKDVDNLANYEFEFHTAIAQASRCKILAEKIEELATLTLVCSTYNEADNHARDIGSHVKVVEAIATGKPELAEQAMRDQLRGIARYTS